MNCKHLSNIFFLSFLINFKKDSERNIKKLKTKCKLAWFCLIKMTYHIIAAAHSALEISILWRSVEVFAHVVISASSANIVTNIVAKVSNIAGALLILLCV